MLPQVPDTLTRDVFLATLMAKVAVAAILATMLARFHWFRRILLTERRDWPERLVFAAGLGIPLTLGVAARIVIHYEAADLTLSGAFLGGSPLSRIAAGFGGADEATSGSLALVERLLRTPDEPWCSTFF